MTPFEYRKGAYRADWDVFEIAAFVEAAGAVISILNGNSDNPIRQRLLPPISKDDRVAEEFRRLAGQQLVDAKMRTLEAFATLLANALINADEANEVVELIINDDQAKAALQALTAIRVTLGKRLEIDSDADSDLLYHQVLTAPDGSAGATNAAAQEQAYLGSLFIAAGFVQDSLVAAMQAQMAPPSDT